jgi:hypothetical protein
MLWGGAWSVLVQQQLFLLLLQSGSTLCVHAGATLPAVLVFRPCCLSQWHASLMYYPQLDCPDHALVCPPLLSASVSPLLAAS